MKFFTRELFTMLNRMGQVDNPESDELFSNTVHAYNEVENRIIENSSMRTKRVIRRLRTWHDAEIKAVSLRQKESSKPTLELTVTDRNSTTWLLTLKAIEKCSVIVPTANDWFTLSWGWCEFNEIEIDEKRKLKLSVLCGNMETEIEVVFSTIWLSKLETQASDEHGGDKGTVSVKTKSVKGTRKSASALDRCVAGTSVSPGRFC